MGDDWKPPLPSEDVLWSLPQNGGLVRAGFQTALATVDKQFLEAASIIIAAWEGDGATGIPVPISTFKYYLEKLRKRHLFGVGSVQGMFLHSYAYFFPIASLFRVFYVLFMGYVAQVIKIRSKSVSRSPWKTVPPFSVSKTQYVIKP